MIRPSWVMIAFGVAALLPAIGAEERFAIRAAAYVDTSGELRQGALIVVENCAAVSEAM